MKIRSVMTGAGAEYVVSLKEGMPSKATDDWLVACW
jgi:hypothetical protein